jgi:membrane protein implicated in regulation of membrane protease activity
MDEIKLLDVVALTEDFDAQGLRRGEVGTVVEKWKDGVFEVEFSDNSGKAYALTALRADQLMKLHFRKDEAA